MTDEPASTLEEAQEMTRVRFAFWIMAGLQAGGAVWCGVVWCVVVWCGVVLCGVV